MIKRTRKLIIMEWAFGLGQCWAQIRVKTVCVFSQTVKFSSDSIWPEAKKSTLCSLSCMYRCLISLFHRYGSFSLHSRPYYYQYYNVICNYIISPSLSCCGLCFKKKKTFVEGLCEKAGFNSLMDILDGPLL